MHSPQRLPVQFDKGTGTPLVLLHGLGNNWKSWSFTLEHLDFKQHRVIALDLLGFGDAPKPAVGYTPTDHADAVAATLEHLSISNAHIAGHSMGCIVALQLASQAPSLVRSLSLFGAPLYRHMPRASWWQRLTLTEGRYFTLFNIVKRHPETIKSAGDLANDLLPFVKGMEITDKTWPAYRRSLEHTIMQTTSFQQAAELTIPTRFINGLFDFFIVRKNTTALRRRNRQHIRTKTVPGPHELTPRQGKTVARLLNQLDS